MMKMPISAQKLALIAVIVSLLAMLIYVALRSGPLAPVPVTVTTVENRSISPALFGIGTIESKYTYRIGPTISGRVKQVNVNIGDRIRAGQLLGEMDPVDLDDRVTAQDAALKQAEASVLAAEAQVRDNTARFTYADAQTQRYEKLMLSQSVSEEALEARRQERQVAEAGLASARANLDAARQELARGLADRAGIVKQRTNLRLVSHVDGLVTARYADPGSTVVAGQPVVEVINPKSLWINVRFNQLNSSGLRSGLPARIVLRSQAGQVMSGKVLLVEPLADSVTEEVLAKVVFDTLPVPLPPLGELAEVSVALPEIPSSPIVPNASMQRVNGSIGVWIVEDGGLRFAPVRVGATDLDGRMQILEGLSAGDRVVVYSHKALKAGSRIKVVERLPGVTL
ncbi:MAG: efflux RND transporter periplasmic adaptor subunit [Nitrospirae bacterium]|nr:efflux RND transporter periplasmic adaptor subunit [Nitrospirota bacterium]